MNILLITETYLPFVAGVSTSTDSIALFMANAGHTVTVISPKPVLPKPTVSKKGITFLHTPSIPDIVYAGKPMTVFPLGLGVIRKTLQKHHFNVVHIQEPGSLGICALYLSRKMKIPTVGALHFTPEQVSRMIPGKPNWLIVPLMKTYIKYIYNQYNAIMVPTQTFADFLTSIGVSTPKTVVSNGVNTDQYYPKPLDINFRKRYGIAGDAFVCLFIGLLDKDKNVITLIEALAYTSQNIRLLVAGVGKEETNLKKRAKELNISHRVTWAGSVTEKEMIDLYHTANAFTILSPYEIQSIVTLQAIASGLPIIAAHAGALPELCRDGQNGFLVETYDYQTVAEKVSFLASHPKICHKFGRFSRRLSLAHHKPTVLKKLEDLYKSLSKRA